MEEIEAKVEEIGRVYWIKAYRYKDSKEWWFSIVYPFKNNAMECPLYRIGETADEKLVKITLPV